MDGPHPLHIYCGDKILPAQRAFFAVVICPDLPERERRLFPRESHAARIIMVIMSVAANDRVRRERRQRKPGNFSRRIRVKDNTALRAFNLEA